MFQVQTSLKTGFTGDRDEGEKGLRSEPASPVSPKSIKLSSESADGSAPHNAKLGGPYSAFTSWKTNLNLDSAKQLLGTGIDKLPNVNEYSKHWLGEHGGPYPLGTHSLGTQGLPMPPVFAGIMQRRKRRENRPRRQRTTFTSEQTLKLELEYNRTEYISRPRRYELAEILNLSENQIKIWFQNRRAKEKRIEKAHQDQQIRSSNLSSIGVTPFSTSGSYSVFCGPCVWPYPPGTLTNVLSPPTKSN